MTLPGQITGVHTVGVPVTDSCSDMVAAPMQYVSGTGGAAGGGVGSCVRVGCAVGGSELTERSARCDTSCHAT
jgi:hypothetical protein